MKFNKTTLFGALLGLIMGLIFTVIALFQYDETLTNSRDVLFSIQTIITKLKLAKSKLTYDRISGLIEKGITVRN